MKERWRIVELWQKLRANTAAGSVVPGVLVTLVDVRGSSYRRPGAHLLTIAEGAYTGTLSGGCLEGEVLRKAAWHVREGAHVENYSTLFDDTAEIPYGLGCGGEIDLLYEEAGAPDGEALLAALEASLAGKNLLVLTLLPEPDQPLRRVIWSGDGALQYKSAAMLEQELAMAEAVAKNLLVQQANAVTLSAEVDGKARRFYVERVLPPRRLFVFGAGDDAQPLVTIAAELGWRTVVADGRAHLAQSKRFPEAEAVHALPMAGAGRLEQFAGLGLGLGLGKEDAVVLMTHSYEQDRWLLEQVLPLAPHYVGLLGARHRSRLLISEVAKALGWSEAECKSRVHAPIGLDLGGDAPEAIALAILAEVQACFHERDARLRREDIVQQDETENKVYSPMRCAADVPGRNVC
ncbi:MAG: XdhC family protein [Acidobacteriaceae bacterium]